VIASLFTKTKELRGTANMFVVNLAFSDFCMMITQFPMFVHNSFNGGQWLFGPAACELYACTGTNRIMNFSATVFQLHVFKMCRKYFWCDEHLYNGRNRLRSL